MQALLQQQQAQFSNSQAQFEKYQAKLIETLSQNFSKQAIAISAEPDNVPSPESLTQRITTKFEPEVHQILIENVGRLPVTVETIRKDTINEEILLEVMNYIQTKWPNGEISPKLRPFFNRRESLSIVDNCLMTGDGVVVPTKLGKQMMQQFHSGHPGTTRMKGLARSFVYWPQMDAEIEQFCQKCELFQMAAKAPPECPEQPWPKSKKPWERIHLDYADPVNGQTYLILVDSFTKWPDVFLLCNTTAQSMVDEVVKVFQNFGNPELIVTDNGTQFISTHFRQFCKENGIEQKFSPPYHPQSNGQAERVVNTFKLTHLKWEEKRRPAIRSNHF
ncbi:hypothetical protein T265_12134 [Opisthorchis viverrini]|uniref:Integrase catalytic domain-containing protein n=1 Tax=Opisthorchis viverrini TaxID=6198 RepID=A0A074ZUG7_OPIVI|nr:hypothetical protein T265_12134 [Opisthorchis viverrini]KER18839.1 hypothetical protein T265_12134 [Opisthorchis viverrini]